MRSLEYKFFLLRHKVDLREYLSKYYSLDFKTEDSNYICTTDPDLTIHRDGKYENTWVRANVSTGDKNHSGIYLKYGNIIDWEAIQNKCSIVEAVAIVSKQEKALTPYKTKHYKKLETLFSRVATRFRYSRTPEVADYLKDRGLDYTSYSQEFDIGSPKTYDSLVNDLITLKSNRTDIEDMLADIYIVRRPLNYEYLPYTPSVIVPVYMKSGDFAGFHGRKINWEGGKRFYNTGFLRELAQDLLYGEDRDGIVESIRKKKQLILTKGIFDFFACYQNGYHQVLATLNKGISAQQFDRVVNYPVKDIIVGFTAPKERDTILGLMHQSLNKVDMSLIGGDQDIDEAVIAGSGLSDIISSALTDLKATEDGRVAAAIKTRKARMDTLTELGQTFLISEANLISLVKTSKKSPRKMKDFLLEQGSEGRSIVPGGKYIRLPKTFITDTILGGFGAELRTLLHLLIKTKGGQRPINYTQSALCADLDVKQQSLNDHLKKLKVAGYLLVKKDIRIEKLKRKQKRTVVFHYYPSTIKFG